MKITNFCSPYLKKKIITLFFFSTEVLLRKVTCRKLQKGMVKEWKLARYVAYRSCLNSPTNDHILHQLPPLNAI